MSSTSIRTYILGGQPSRPKIHAIARYLKSPELLTAFGFPELADALTIELAAPEPPPEPAPGLSLPGHSLEAHQLIDALDRYVQAAIEKNR